MDVRLKYAIVITVLVIWYLLFAIAMPRHELSIMRNDSVRQFTYVALRRAYMLYESITLKKDKSYIETDNRPAEQ